MALLNLETCYSFPNTDSTNNSFKYSPDNGKNWFTIQIPEGSYEIRDIDAAIKQQMRTNNHYDDENDKYFISVLGQQQYIENGTHTVERLSG